MRKLVPLLTLGLAVPFTAHAAVPTLDDVLTATGISAAGYVSGSYTYGFNHGSALLGRAFDSNANSFTFNQAAFTLSKLPASGFGGLVNVIAGDDASVINGNYGDGSGKFNLTQAYVQYATGGLTLIGGRFVTLAGAEVINDTQNSNISRSFLFVVAEPLVHTGVRATYKLSDALSVVGGLNNSAVSGQATDNNTHKTGELGFIVAPLSSLTISVVDYYGLEASGSNQRTNFLDGVVAFQATKALQLVVNADWVRVWHPGGGQISGVAAYANYQICDKLKSSLRVEYVGTSSGGVSGADAKEVTLTLDYAPAKSFDLLGEVRLDRSDKSVFPDGTNPNKTHDGDVAVKAIYKFGG